MEILLLVQEMFLEGVQFAAGYRIGQAVLRQIDKMLWVLEKSARWAVPPPLDQDDHPQPELIRPVSWILFFFLLVMLRITRESISIINLFRGKPPLRSADVVMYIQSKRRYVRAVKYQGSRAIRMRSQQTKQSESSWFSKLGSMVESAMCVKRPQANNIDANNISDDEIVVVKSNKSAREDTMERLIEKMMADMNSDTEDDSSYTLTTVPSLESMTEGSVEGENDLSKNSTSVQSNISTSTPVKDDRHNDPKEEKNKSPAKPKPEPEDNRKSTKEPNADPEEKRKSPEKSKADPEEKRKSLEKPKTNPEEKRKSPEKPKADPEEKAKENNKVGEKEPSNVEDAQLKQHMVTKERPKSPKLETENFIQKETAASQNKQAPPKKPTIANGQAIKSSPKRKKGGRNQVEKRESEAPAVAVAKNNNNNMEVNRRTH